MFQMAFLLNLCPSKMNIDAKTIGFESPRYVRASKSVESMDTSLKTLSLLWAKIATISRISIAYIGFSGMDTSAIVGTINIAKV